MVIFKQVELDKNGYRSFMEFSTKISFFLNINCICFKLIPTPFQLNWKESQQTEIQESSLKTEADAFLFEKTSTVV